MALLGQAQPIVGGSPAGEHKYPFAVYLSVETEPRWHAVCGGTLVSSRHIVTAAHCVHGAGRAQMVKVGLGSASVGEQTRREAQAITVHPQFDARSLANDIAVVEIDAVAPGAAVQRAPVYFGPVDAGSVVTAMGWGLTSNAPGARTVARMNAVELEVADPRQCRAVDDRFASSNGPLLCTATRPGARDQCSGDSGAPVVIALGRPAAAGSDLRLVALTSFGDNIRHDSRPPCADPAGFGFSTHVAHYQRFLTNATGLSRAQLEAPVRPAPSLAHGLHVASSAPPRPADAGGLALALLLLPLLLCALLVGRR
ncbi:hypothetical protein H4R21_005197 [Coemansia helicoidea]|uniref:Uncharacterized protein n=1 Tax=Coemansia helicoidea TaxID=1286919 RepID=A0ACC1KTP1_9FUNG|nr:hypothetical protein H4R21_005197 [Coemansia helicoidea]